MVSVKQRSRGFTLIEMMVAIAVGSLIVIGVVSVFTGQTDAVKNETARDSLQKELTSTLATVTTLLRHAEAASIKLTLGNGSKRNDTGQLFVADDSLTVDFMLPANLSIWPNDVAPFSNRAVRLTWTNDIASTGRDTLHIATAATLAGLAGATLTRVSGAATEGSPRVANFDLWPVNSTGDPTAAVTDAALGGYLIQLDIRAGQIDATYENPLDPKGPLKNYRTVSASTHFMPRN